MVYSYVYASGRNNGNLVSVNPNSYHWNFDSVIYSYDSLNRVATAQTPFDFSLPTFGPANCWSESLGYDSWGNLLSITPGSGPYTGCTQEGLSVAANPKNQVIGSTYDAAGNLISTPPPAAASYTYNAEGQLTTTAGVTYTYDGDGKRVMKSSGKTYWFGTGSNVLAETNSPGTSYTYYYFQGKLVSRREPAWVGHYGLDHLGSARFVYGNAGATDLSNFYPFGGARALYSAAGNTFKFTGKDRDTESGLDHFLFRQYSSSLGRWTTPDPARQSACSLEDPRSLNLYAYVKDNPINAVDPLGLWDWSIFGSFVSGGGGHTPRRRIIPIIIFPPLFHPRHSDKPRHFPLPVVFPVGLFSEPDEKTQTLRLSKGSCTEHTDRNGAGYSLQCHWRATDNPCGIRYAQYARGGCADAETAYIKNPDGSTTYRRCVPDLQINLNCEGSSVHGPWVTDVTVKINPK